MKLETERLYLRKMTPDDFDAYRKRKDKNATHIKGCARAGR